MRMRKLRQNEICHPFGIKDERGRDVGGVYVKREEDGQVWARVQSARNGVPYGASGPRGYFESHAEADAWIEEKLTSMRARYLKKYAVGASA